MNKKIYINALAEFVGKQYENEEIACWLLLQEVYKVKLGINIPDLDQQAKKITEKIENREQIRALGIEISKKTDGCIIAIVGFNNVVKHVGIYSMGKVLHYIKGYGAGFSDFFHFSLRGQVRFYKCA